MSKGLTKVIKENGLLYYLAEDRCYYLELKTENLLELVSRLKEIRKIVE